MADALAVLDRFGLERAWVIGHSWGGHLALHLAVAHPERVAGLLCINPLGADLSVFDDFEETLSRTLTPTQMERIHEIDERRRARDVTEADLVERFGLIWVPFFVDPGDASEPPAHVGVEASIETNRSISEHSDRRTLANGLGGVTAPGALRARRGRPAAAALLDRDRRADSRRAGRDDPRLRPLPVARAAGRLPLSRRARPQSVTSAAAPYMRESRGTTSSTLTCEHQAMSSSSPGGPYVRALIPSIASG